MSITRESAGNVQPPLAQGSPPPPSVPPSRLPSGPLPPSLRASAECPASEAALLSGGAPASPPPPGVREHASNRPFATIIATSLIATRIVLLQAVATTLAPSLTLAC